MSTRSTISSTVRHLLIEKGMRNAELASRMGVSSSYMPIKIKEGRWVIDELDKLAEIFNLNPSDFVLGYQHIKENHEFPSD
jgi:DNA-binding Xre family transcriptional regulator